MTTCLKVQVLTFVKIIENTPHYLTINHKNCMDLVNVNWKKLTAVLRQNQRDKIVRGDCLKCFYNLYIKI